MCLIYITLYQQNRANETIQSGKLVRTKLTSIYCANGKSKSSLYFRNSEGVIKHVNISYPDCLKFKRGDTIGVFENMEDDWYEIDPASLK